MVSKLERQLVKAGADSELKPKRKTATKTTTCKTAATEKVDDPKKSVKKPTARKKSEPKE